MKVRIDGLPWSSPKVHNKASARKHDDTASASGHTDLESMELGAVVVETIMDGEQQLVVGNSVRVQSNMDLTRKIDSLTYGDAAKFRHICDIPSTTQIREAFQAFHIMMDVAFTIELADSFPKDLLARILEVSTMHGLCAHHSHIHPDGDDGFDLMVLFGKGHLSAHCDQQGGKLSLDLRTGGRDPDCTRKMSRDVLFYLRQHLGTEATYQIHRLPRTPDYQTDDAFSVTSTDTIEA